MLLSNETGIIRVLQTHGDKSLVIDCIKRTMPKWILIDELAAYVECSEAELYERTDTPQGRQLSPSEERVARNRFTEIAGVLPFVGDKTKRSQMIDMLAAHQSKQTLRKHLCLYLAYQDISILAPKPKDSARELTPHEKNFRWALNKYYYTQHGNSLQMAYTMMLKEKYCDSLGQLTEHPSFYQFRYYYRQHKSMQKYHISRNGIKSYQRDYRPLLGDGVQQFANLPGIAMLDSTICDIYLVDDCRNVVGRPILTACIDAFSGMCMGYHLSWEGGTYSLRGLMLNVITDKQDWCKSHGVFIEDGEWDACQMPGVLVTDLGTEYASQTFAQLTELGVQITNLPPYRPDLKPMVERWFKCIQDTFKPILKGKGVIEADWQERGAVDYRKQAVLTMEKFERVILHCIVYANSKRIVENFPYTEEMLAAAVKPFPSEIFAWGKQQMGANLLSIQPKQLIQTLLPRATARFKRNGLQVNGLRYRHDDYTEAFLSGGEAAVAYNPDDVCEVYLIDQGKYIPFTLIESRFEGKSLDAVQMMQKAKKQIVSNAQEENLQAKIDVVEHIQVIANQERPTPININHIRSTRQKEQKRSHLDFVKESEVQYG